MINRLLDVKEIDDIGDKAKSLILMKKQGFNVPEGIIIDKYSYYEITKVIEKEIKSYLKRVSRANITRMSRQIVGLFDKIKISKRTRDKINSFLSDDKLYAVRSSGTIEKESDYSFIGEYDTFLNTPKEDVINRIIDCYKSAYKEEILQSFLDDLSYDNLAISVIVQEMCDANINGVCYTVNPITGKDTELIINVSKGVSKEGEEEHDDSTKYLYSRVEEYHYDWLERNSYFDERNVILSNNYFVNIAESFFDIHMFYGYPCCIEFAIKDKKLYILQVRKVTNLKYRFYADMWTTEFFKDGGISTSICTPFMWSLYEYAWEYSLKKFILKSKLLTKKELNTKLINMFFARPYWNLSILKRVLSKFPKYKEKEFDEKYGVYIDYDGDGDVTRKTLSTLCRRRKINSSQKTILRKRKARIEKLKIVLLNRYNDYKKMHDNSSIDDLKGEFYKLTHDDFLESESNYFWQVYINSIFQSKYKEMLKKYVSDSEYLTLIGNIKDLAHMTFFYKMWEISRIIRRKSEYRIYWNEHEVDEIEEAIKNQKEREDFKAIRNHLQEYGFHSVKELDITQKRFCEDMTQVLLAIKDMIQIDDKNGIDEAKEKVNLSNGKILDGIRNRLSFSSEEKVEALIEDIKDMLWWTEEFKDISTRYYYLIRVYALMFAERLKKKDVIDDVNDIWFLKIENLWLFISGQSKKPSLRELIKNNKKYYLAYRNFLSEDKIGYGFNETKSKSSDDNEMISGTVVSNGVIIGTARIIDDISKISSLNENDILITKYTDNAWTPYFSKIIGVVTEYGNLFCHAGITSRELGIPCIVGCTGATKRIKDGQKIRLDGATGIITILR